MDASFVGRTIRQRRIDLGWSLRRLSDVCGQRPETINAIELGKSQNPTLRVLRPIVTALGLSLDEVLDEPEPVTV